MQKGITVPPVCCATFVIPKEEAMNTTAPLQKTKGKAQPTIIKNYPVTGMSCASCAVSVESMLQAEPGVIKAGVNYANGVATVEFDPAQASETHLKLTIQSIGYDLVIEDETTVAETVEKLQAQKLKSLRLKMTWLLVFAAPLVVIGMAFMNMPYANYIM